MGTHRGVLSFIIMFLMLKWEDDDFCVIIINFTSISIDYLIISEREKSYETH